MNLSVNADNKGKDILILGEGPTQRLNDTTQTAEAKYPINFIQSNRRFVTNLHYQHQLFICWCYKNILI